MVEGGPW